MPTRISIAEYDRRHGLSAQLTEAVNLCYVRMDEHPAAFLSEHFARAGRADTVERVVCREILDARGVPAVEATVIANGKALGVASVGGPLVLGRDIVPSGRAHAASRTVHRRDAGPGSEEEAKGLRFAGKGCKKVARECEAAATSALSGLPCAAQTQADSALEAADGTEELSTLGANAIAPVSLALCAAASECAGTTLWQKVAQARWARTAVPSRLFMPTPIAWLLSPPPGSKLLLTALGIIVTAVPGAEMPLSFAAMQDACTEVYHALGRRLSASGQDPPLAPGGGYAHPWESLEAALQALKDAASAATEEGQLEGVQVRVAIRCGGRGSGFQIEEGQTKTWQELAAFYAQLSAKEKEAGRLPVAYIEDPFPFDDPAPCPAAEWGQGSQLTGAEIPNHSPETLIVGAELYSTAAQRLREGRRRRLTGGAFLSLDEVGTLSRLVEAATAWAEVPPVSAAEAVAGGGEQAADGSVREPVVMGMRPNETGCPHIADVAVGFQAHFISLGAPASVESAAKWNRLCRIEEELAADDLLGSAPPLGQPKPPLHPPGAREALESAGDGKGRRASQSKGKKK